MTKAYFGVGDFFPHNRAELLTAEPGIHDLMQTIWGPVVGSALKQSKPAMPANGVLPTQPDRAPTLAPRAGQGAGGQPHA